MRHFFMAMVFVTSFLGCSVFTKGDKPIRKGAIMAYDLTCEYLSNPLGLDHPSPRLGWKLKTPDPETRGQEQTAYRILVASGLDLLNQDQGDIWDSGKVASSQQAHIPFTQTTLKSNQTCYWKARVWDKENTPSSWSDPAWWEMGLLHPKDWKGCWIEGPKGESAPLFCKEFKLDKTVSRARLHISGLGIYEASLNGQPVGDRVLDPGWTDYSKRVLYSTYDVTKLCQRGENSIQVLVGDGWFNPLPLKMWGRLNLRDHLTIGRPCVIAQLNITFKDQSKTSISTSTDWKVKQSPIVKNNLYLGEEHDARLEAKFRAYASQAKYPLGPLKAQFQPPIRKMEILKPIKITEPKPGVFIFDMGKVIAGWARLRVKGPAGAAVTLRYGELLYPDGALNGMTAVCGQIKGKDNTAFQQDRYILKGQGQEIFEPRFTFHSFRFVELTGYPGKPDLSALEGVKLCADLKRVGSFSCSDTMLNQIQEMVINTFEGNLLSVQSDCPGREKFGYGGDIVATSEAFIQNLDMAAFYTKTVRDFQDAARPNGGLTETAPYVGIADRGLGGRTGPIGWTLAHSQLLEQLYRFYGDTRLIEEQYQTAYRHMEFIRTKAQNNLIDSGISDHESLAPRPTPLTGTLFYYEHARIMARLAELTNRGDDKKQYQALADRIKAAFVQKFLNPETGKVHTGTQTCQAAALYSKLIPQEPAFELLLDTIRNKDNSRFTTGIFGTKYLLDVLSRKGETALALDLVKQTECPGFGHMLELGATTLWEHWRFSDNTFSHNHPMFGSVSHWLFQAIGGLYIPPEAKACDLILIEPPVLENISWAKTSFQSIRGDIIVDWRRENGLFTLCVKIPVNTRARVVIPTKDASKLMENGKPALGQDGIQLIRKSPGRVEVRLKPGAYRFLSLLK